MDTNTQCNQGTEQISEQTDTPVKTTYVVAVAFSRWPLGQLCQFLEERLFVTQDQIGVMRIDRFKGKETNRTILLLTRSVFDQASERGYTQQQQGLDFKLAEYELRDHNLPKEGYTRNFFVPLPNSLSGDEARDQLQNKLDVLCRFGMFTDKPRLKIPLKSRETGEHRGQAYVTFSHQTPVTTTALARVLLHDTRLYTKQDDTEDFERMQCFWAKEKSDNQATSKQHQKKQPKKGTRRGGRGPTKVPVNSPVQDSVETPMEDSEQTSVNESVVETSLQVPAVLPLVSMTSLPSVTLPPVNHLFNI